MSNGLLGFLVELHLRDLAPNSDNPWLTRPAQHLVALREQTVEGDCYADLSHHVSHLWHMADGR